MNYSIIFTEISLYPETSRLWVLVNITNFIQTSNVTCYTINFTHEIYI